MRYRALSLLLLGSFLMGSGAWLYHKTNQEKIKLYAFYTPSHEHMKDAWFLPSIQDDYELIVEKYDQECESATIMRAGWKQTMIHKIDLIIRAVQENPGKIFIHSDVDIQFFRPTKDIIVTMMKDKDLVIQRDDPRGEVCAGFFACRGNAKTLKLWQEIRRRLLLPETRGHDQDLLNSLIYRDNPYNIAWDYLPADFMGGGTLTALLWFPGRSLPVPETIAMHHANYTIGIDNKLAQLRYVKDLVQERRKAV